LIHKKVAGRLKINRLTKAERKELFKTVRYSFVKHEDLLHLLTLPRFDLAKAFVAQGLSVRLNPYENAIKSDLEINTQPRTYYDAANSSFG
jgi:hypothetical protein